PHSEPELAALVARPVAVLDRILEELAGDHGQRLAAIDVGEDRREAVLHRRAQEVHVGPVAADGQVDREAETAVHHQPGPAVRSSRRSSLAKTRSASKLSFCHFSAWL